MRRLPLRAFSAAGGFDPVAEDAPQAPASNDALSMDEESFRALIDLVWEQHQKGSFDRSYYLWNVLMFLAWLESNHST